MRKTAKDIHNEYCDYMISKATSQKCYAVKRPEKKKQTGIKTSGLSKTVLASQLAELF